MSKLRRVEWGPVVFGIIGLALVVSGIWRLHERPHFTLMDAVSCALSIIPAAILLLVVSYVIQHARLVAVIPIVFTLMLVGAYPGFAVAVGVAILGMLVGPAVEASSTERTRR